MSKLEFDEQFDPSIPEILPHNKMYLLQVGDQLFRVSGASLSSDAPSYFTEYFKNREKQNHPRGDDDAGSTDDAPEGHVLYIDRCPRVFKLICQHLQGYAPEIRDENDYTKLYADAVYYNLPRLCRLLKHSNMYYVNIGGTSFRVPRMVFSQEGNHPNYFDVTNVSLFEDVEHVILKHNLIRPPPLAPVFVNRSPELFAELLILLRGGSLALDAEKRRTLLRECRYYRFLRLEQQLLDCRISWNVVLGREEIALNLQDIVKLAVSLPDAADGSALQTPCGPRPLMCSNPTAESPRSPSSPSSPLDDNPPEPSLKKPKLNPPREWCPVLYTRKFLDSVPRELIFQIDTLGVTVLLNQKHKVIHVCLSREARAKFVNVFSDALLKQGIPLALLERTLDCGGSPCTTLVLPACLSICDLSVNGLPCRNVCAIVQDSRFLQSIPNLASLTEAGNSTTPGLKFNFVKSMWKLGVKDSELMMIAIKGEAISGIKEHNKRLEYL
ncbi:LAMI_0H16402g1_1 [Lachancea mirantina]|uniref:LAMI_0H16402g1_1 n=1 Tax=Lachancea mirantina TaxID=1230905 RepID=A0A1G4KIT9_9SACH|nr:LAMI_0H16402g1_1 [Lachancea mirantina]